MYTGMVIVPKDKQYCCYGCRVMIHSMAPVYKPLLRRMLPCFYALLFTAPVVLAEDAAGIMQTGESSAPGTGVEAAVSQRERAEQVQEAVLALPPASRAVLVLREYEGLSYKEISHVLEIPLGTVMSRIWRARSTLAESLGDTAPLPFRRVK